MNDDYHIHLNFHAADLSDSVRLFRRAAVVGEDRPGGLRQYRLPPPVGGQEWVQYWVSPEAQPGLERYQIDVGKAPDLVRWLILAGLRKAAQDSPLSAKVLVRDGLFSDDLTFLLKAHPEGHEALVIEPYFLRAEQRFGLLADFRFRKAPTVPFSRRVQQLSLSLNARGRRNLDFYADKIAKVDALLDQVWNVISPVRIPGCDGTTTFERNLFPLRADRLRSKIYLFAGDREARNQFSGLKQCGPLKGLEADPQILFVFREQDRSDARTLWAALSGRDRSFGFPGFETLFKRPLQVSRDPIVLQDFSDSEIERALERTRAERLVHTGVLPIFVLPDGEDEGYIRQKARFVNAEIPTQVCTLRVLRDPEMLKWAIANIALQIFCKLGGQPWRVRPTPAEKSLIIGISQSHKVRALPNGRRAIEKYFAFSVLTDSSGLFQEIEVLGESEEQADYHAKLRQSLQRLLREKSEAFGRVVVHTSFRLSRKEMSAIEDTVKAASRAAAGCRFAVVKVNHQTRFFGVNKGSNSLVPYEATQVRLGTGEYLLWFEGLLPGSPTVSKAFPGPTHLRFLRVDDQDPISPDVLLQDLVNLSGANWRGFNAKSAPVSVFYCHLVADLVHSFHDRGLPMPAVKDIRPWFL